MVQFEPGWPRKRLAGHILWFGLWVGVTVVALFLRPSEDGHGTHQQLGLPPCPSVLFFGRLCPGCGMTTSFAETVRGHFADAWQANPFGLVVYVLFTLSAWACLYGFWTEKRMSTETKPFQITMGTLIAAFMVFSVYRWFAMPVAPDEIVQPAPRIIPWGR